MNNKKRIAQQRRSQRAYDLSRLSQAQRLGFRIRQVQSARGITQTELAARICVSRSELWRYQQGLVEPDAERLQLIANALECRVTDLWEQPGAPVPRRWVSTEA